MIGAVVPQAPVGKPIDPDLISTIPEEVCVHMHVQEIVLFWLIITTIPTPLIVSHNIEGLS